MADDINEIPQAPNPDSDNESFPPPSIIRRVCNFAANHKFFVNFMVMNVVCLVAVQTQLENRTTAEVIMIYNAVFLGCALLSQFVTRGYYANDHPSMRARRVRGGQRSPSGNFEEEDAEGAGNVVLPLPEGIANPVLPIEEGMVNGIMRPEDEIPPDHRDMLNNPDDDEIVVEYLRGNPPVQE